MSRLHEQYIVSTSHMGLRAAAFALALAAALAAFSYGVSRMGHKDPGYYEIETDPTDAAPLYSSGITLMYYFEGESEEIKARMTGLQALYGGVLLRSYQLLDEKTAYEGYVNLADLNAGLWEDGTVTAQVSPELRAVLLDAWEKTGEGRGANLFAGALYAEWDSILALDDLSGFDPAQNPDVARRIEELARETADLGHFSLTADGDRVTITVSREYRDFLAENEYECDVILTAGRMADAYRLDMIRDVLEENGFTNGYLTTDSGLTLSLSGHQGGTYLLYGPGEDGGVPAAGVPAEANSACSFLHAFPLAEGEFMYHALPGGRYYHPNFSLLDGGFPGLLASSFVICADGDVVSACYENLSLYCQTQRPLELSSGAGAWICWEEPRTVHTNAPGQVKAEEGFTVQGL